jgi:hypothetical protein
MSQQQCVDPFRRLVGGIVADDTGQSGEMVWRGDELCGPFRSRPATAHSTSCHPRRHRRVTDLAHDTTPSPLPSPLDSG